MASTINATPTSSGLIQTADSTGVLALQTGGTTAVTVTGSQNVGIGIANPATRLHVSNSSKAVLTVATTGASSGSAIDLIGSTSFKNWSIGCSAVAVNGSLEFTPSTTNGGSAFSTPSVSIEQNGNFLVNTPAKIGDGKVSIAYIGNTQQGLVINDTTGTASAQPIQLRSNNTVSGYFTTTGGTSAFVNTSDYRLKENVTPITGALDTVKALKPVNYSWKLDGSLGQGFIAHELQETIPYAVFGIKDAVNEDDSINPQGIDQTRIIAVLTAAIQELNAKVDAQALEIQALKATPLPAENT